MQKPDQAKLACNGQETACASTLGCLASSDAGAPEADATVARILAAVAFFRELLWGLLMAHGADGGDGRELHW